MGFGEVIVAVIGVAATAGTLCSYLVMRADMARLNRAGARYGR